MKKVVRLFLVAILAGMCNFSIAQNDEPDYMKAPKSNEKVLGTISLETKEKESWSNQEVYALFLEKAKTEYPNRVIDIREMEITWNRRETTYYETIYTNSGEPHRMRRTRWLIKCFAVGKVVDLRDPEAQTYSNLSQALSKALRKLPEDSRLAIDQVSVIDNMDSETLKDQILDVLLDKGYRVVAKEYLQKLDKEIKDAKGSGYFNPDTMVDEGNFSAVGYFINVKVTESSIRG